MFYQNLILSLAAWLYHWSKQLLSLSNCIYRWSNQLLDHAEDLMVTRFIEQDRKARK
jgi:hypothetical protein